MPNKLKISEIHLGMLSLQEFHYIETIYVEIYVMLIYDVQNHI